MTGQLHELKFHVDIHENKELDITFLLISCTEEHLEKLAAEAEIELRIDERKLPAGLGHSTPTYKEFRIQDKHMFKQLPNGSLFSSLDRIRLFCPKLKDILPSEHTWDCYALNSEYQKKQLVRNWANSWFSPQPLDDIRDYYGEKIALYFAFLGHYTRALISLSIVGCIAQLFQLINNDLDHVSVPIYCVFLALWSTIWLELWKRAQVTWAFQWDVMDFEEEEEIRPEFVGVIKRGRYTDAGFVDLEEMYHSIKSNDPEKAEEIPLERYDPPIKRILRYFFSIPIVTIFVSTTIIGTASILFFKNVASLPQPFGYGKFGEILASALNAAFIVTMNVVYKNIAAKLNDFENHPTATAHEDALIAKTFIFQFVNSYISLFFIAFIKGRDLAIPGLSGKVASCRGSCFEELATQLLTLVVFKQFVGQIQELSVPLAKKFAKVFLKKKGKKEEQGNDDDEDGPLEISKRVEAEYFLPPYEGTFGDYNEMAIQFGYVVMFAAAFPVASAASLLNNFIEIRVDAIKLLNFSRRPNYSGCQDIGTWQKVFEILSVLSVITNCCLLGFTSMWMSGKCQFLTQFDCQENLCRYYEGDSMRAVQHESHFNFHINDTEISLLVNCSRSLYGSSHSCCPYSEEYLTHESLKQVTETDSLFLNSYSIIWVVLLTEHALLFIKYGISELIPDKPGWIERIQASQRLEKDLLFSNGK
eukprot:c21486_g1_i1.p1 GENE.c21486_g1_i1~~c21486_g1_i1.p1  ORF type:complete len:747 (-),score=296.37 c21486_g1_i1:59-2164(-)